MLATMVKKAIEEADLGAARLVAEYCLGRPRRQSTTDVVAVDLPAIKDAASLVQASSNIFEALSRQEISLDEAKALGELLSLAGKNIELHNVDVRLKALEGDGGPEPDLRYI